MTTYYVSSIIGSDSNAGTSSSAPLATLQDAANLVKPGDTVLVMNGTYTGELDITTSGTASAPITFEAAPGQTPVINSSGAWNAILIKASYIVINGFTVVGDAANYTAAQALAGSAPGNPNFDGSGISVTGNPGVFVPNHVTIENNTVYNEPGGGIGSQYADYVSVLNNVVVDNAHWSAYGNSGISLNVSVNSDTNPGVHNVISGNTVIGNAQLVPTDTGGGITDGEGIILDTNYGSNNPQDPTYVGEFLVENNIIYGSGSAGIESFLTNNAVITGNTLYGNNAENVQGNPSATEIFNNQSPNFTTTNNITTPPSNAPAAPAITSVAEGSNGYVVTLTGTAPDGSTVIVSNNGSTTAIGVATASSTTGAWTLTAQIPAGSYVFTAIDANSVGVSATSSPYDFTVSPPSPASISSITESPSTGVINVGNTVRLALNFNEAVTVVGGTPTLTLNDGGTASFTGGSGGNTLTFSYTVGAGQNTASLAATAVNLNGATVTSATTVTPGSGGSLTDANGNVWSFGAAAGGGNYILLCNGVQFGGGSGMALALDKNGVIWSENTQNYWYMNTGTAWEWIGTTGPTTAPSEAVNLSLSGLTQIGPQIGVSTAPTISSLTESPSSGDLDAGKVVTLTVTMSKAVTVAGGTPTLTLNDGGTATYTGGSGTNALTFSYSVGASDTNVASLAATAVNLNGATIKDGSGNAGSLSLSGISQAGPQIDTNTAISAISEVPSSGILNAGKTVTYTLTMNEAVTVNTTAGSPTLALNDGGTATYTGGSGTNALTFSYTVLAGQNTPDLMVSAVNLNGATMMDGAGNAANLSLTGLSQGSPQVDTTPPTVSSVTATAGSYNAGKVLTLTLNMSEAVNVTGTPTLTLNDGGTASYASGSGSSALTFSYTVGAGQSTAGLAVTAVNGTITDLAGNVLSTTNLPETFAGVVIDTTTPSVSSVVASGSGITAGSGDLGVGSVVTLTINLNEAVTVAGGTPTLTLNDGGTASYTGGSGSNALTFSYTVAAGQNNADLAVTGVNLNSATVKNGAGTAANLAGAVANPAGTLQISTTPPVISAISETPSSGILNTGKIVTYSITMSETVTVNTAGGSPTLTFNDGGTGTYVGGSGSNTLTFSYTVLPGQNTPDLMVSAVNLNGATIEDGAGNATNLSLTGVSQGSPVIDTTPPTVSSVSATAGDYNVGQALALTLNMSEAVAVAGTLTLTLNDGGTATYTGGSGTNALTFSYAVGAGQNTSGLAVTAINGTITDLAGNALSAANLPETFAGVAISVAAPVVSSVVSSGTGITAGTGDLAAGSVVTLTVNLNEAVTVAGGPPTLTLNDGGVATYTGGSGTNALTFTYRVATGQNTPDLAVTTVNLNSATVTDSAGNAANLAGAAITTLVGTLQIDTTAPTVAQVVASPGTGKVTTNHTVNITLNMSEAVTVTGTPTLLLNDGGSATYDAMRSSANSLVFDYVVGSQQVTTDLKVSGFMLPTGSSILDLAGNNAVLSGAGANLGLQINSTTKGAGGSSSLTIPKGSELELFGASKANVTFSSGTGELKLDDSLAFTGRISGLTAADAVDLSDISYGVNTKASFSGTTRGGTLTVTDGSHTSKIALLGNYLSSGWTLSSDGNGGTVVVDPPLPPATPSASGNQNAAEDILAQRLALLVQGMASTFATSAVSESGTSMTGLLDSASHSNSLLAQAIQQHFQHS
jgi:Bacterial Ig-like domain